MDHVFAWYVIFFKKNILIASKPEKGKAEPKGWLIWQTVIGFKPLGIFPVPDSWKWMGLFEELGKPKGD